MESAIKNYIINPLIMVFTAISGPVGIVIAYGVLTQIGGFRSGGTNVQVLKTFYQLDFYLVSMFYNILVGFGIALLLWLLKGFKISFLELVKWVFVYYLCFVPLWFFILLITNTPLEGNIIGFIYAPLFLLTAAAGGITFLVLIIRKTIKLAKEQPKVPTTAKLFTPYLLIIALLGYNHLNLTGEANYENVELLSYSHDDFTWGISYNARKMRGKVEKGSKGDAFLFITNKDGETTNYNLSEILIPTPHTIYTKDNIVRLVHHGFSNPRFKENPNFKPYKLANYPDSVVYKIDNSHSLFIDNSWLNPDQFEQLVADFIQHNNDIYWELGKNTSGTYNDIYAAVYGKLPSKEASYFNFEGATISLLPDGKLWKGTYGNSLNRSSSDVLGHVEEGYLYLNKQPTYGGNNIEKINISLFKNEDGNVISDLYQVVNLFDCSTNIEKAVKECTSINELHLIDTTFEGIPENIGLLQHVREINSKHYNIGIIPNAFCNLKNLHTVNFYHSTSLLFPPCMEQLRELQSIEAVNCGLTEFPQEILKTPNLVYIRLPYNPFTSLPKTIVNLPILEEIEISYHPNLSIPNSLINFDDGTTRTIDLTMIVENKQEFLEATKLLQTIKSKKISTVVILKPLSEIF